MPTLPQTANLLTKDFPLPTTFRVGLAYDVITRGEQPAHGAGRLQPAEQQYAGLQAGERVDVEQRIGGSNFGFALPGQLQLHRGQ